MQPQNGFDTINYYFFLFHTLKPINQPENQKQKKSYVGAKQFHMFINHSKTLNLVFESSIVKLSWQKTQTYHKLGHTRAHIKTH